MNKLLVLTAAVAMLTVGNVSASFINVTTHDGHGETISEDQEMDAGQFNQAHEVEAFLWDGASTDLSLVGGYDFLNGYESDRFDANGSRLQVVSGDIFIDLGRNGNYDYALDLDLDAGSYTVYDVTDDNIVNVADLWNHSFANPFEVDGGAAIGTGALVYNTGLSDADIGFGLQGGFHNQIILDDLDAFGITSDFATHYTMSCGNDLVTAEVPEPSILALMGLGLFGVAFIRRKRS